MSSKMRWDDPQRQIYLRYANDGVADMLVGAAFALAGLMLVSDMPFMPIWIIVLMLPISWALKRVLTIPRLSEDEALAQVQNQVSLRWTKWAVVAGALLLLAVVLTTMLLPESMGAVLQPLLSWTLIGLSLAGVLVTIGLLYRAWHWLGYALLVIPAMYLVSSGVVDFPQALAGLGALIFLGGLVLAVRFVAGHPRLAG